MKTRYSIFLVFLLNLLLATQVWAQNDNNFLLANEYFETGDFEKAVQIYEKLTKNPNNIYNIHTRYYEALLRLERFDKAESYLKKACKEFSTEALFHVAYHSLLQKLNKKQEADKVFNDFFGRIKKDENLLLSTARELSDIGQYDMAEKMYLEAGKIGRQDLTFELANLYALAGQMDKMIRTYVDLLDKQPEQSYNVQNILQSRIREEADLDRIEPILLEKARLANSHVVFAEMLVWYYLQRKAFYKAFIQAKAVDKRKDQGGLVMLDIGELAHQNKEYKDAVRIFEYLVENYKEQGVYLAARNALLHAKEEQIKNTFPMDLEKIRSLVADYKLLLQENGLDSETIPSAMKLAMLQAFYLQELDAALLILEDILKTPRLPADILAQAKLNCGDILLLKSEWWDASLYYSQVEKAEKEKNLGHMAKLKNAKLSYYRGDFELAKEHLDILKLATSREIANDAMDLALLIQDNLELDTSTLAMEEFAQADLLVFQQRYEDALKRYKEMLTLHNGHTLTDDILWEISDVLYKVGRFTEAVPHLERIMSEFGTDLYGDDANFLLGTIYEFHLKNKDKAMEYYKNQLLLFPGSIHNAEARKRFRTLRGDGVQ
ncbi:MAG: hypothetical protein EAZ57_02280 [Cytophagales bacterium]|nr:MAG: hypothetical protein EAZ67_02305 [Cytophagales bacterium]TAF61945.1 MAG: hypothetical protein EAZ57_02280 [Cytophagales bacterium]